MTLTGTNNQLLFSGGGRARSQKITAKIKAQL
jgi:hypothetical protein